MNLQQWGPVSACGVRQKLFLILADRLIHACNLMIFFFILDNIIVCDENKSGRKFTARYFCAEHYVYLITTTTLTLYSVNPPFHGSVIFVNTIFHALPVSAIATFYDPRIACIGNMTVMLTLQ